LVRSVARTLGIDHGGFDVAMVNGHPYLFEFNRLFGLDGLQTLGLRMDELIYAHLKRLSTPPKPRPLAPKGGGLASRRRPRAA
jgi:ribosomal protein S6--L-glutamate ligase